MLKKFCLILIILFSLFIRICCISSLPPPLFYDEADAGYQAMVFNQNQSDYYGNKFPVHFRSFGDYRTSLHIYSIALIQKITNNLELSVRLPSAIFGTLSVFVIFLITGSLIPSFLLAISPWAIHYSRIGFEASGMIFLILTAIYFWQRFIKDEKIKYLYLACLSICLTPYFYSTAKLILVIIVFLFGFIWWPNIKKFGITKLILPFLFSLLLLLPMAKDSVTGKAGFRFSYISIFALTHRQQTVDKLRYQDASIDHPEEIGLQTTFLSSLFHNKYQLLASKFISNYINSFSTNFLLLKGDLNPRHGFGNHGLIYLIDLIFFVIGIIVSFKKKNADKISKFFFWLFIFSPLPYSLTIDSDSPHATRLIIILPSIIYFTFIGIKSIQKKYHNSIIPIIIIYFFSIFSFWHYYYYHYSNESADMWGSGTKEAVIATNKYSQNNLIFSSNYSSFVSPFLFYRPYLLKPNTSILDNLKQASNNSFSGQILDSRYYFGNINWSNLSQLPPNSIFIVPEAEKNQVPGSLRLIEKINKKYEMATNFYIYEFDGR